MNNAAVVKVADVDKNQKSLLCSTQGVLGHLDKMEVRRKSTKTVISGCRGQSFNGKCFWRVLHGTHKHTHKSVTTLNCILQRCTIYL